MKYALFRNVHFKQVSENVFGIYHPFNNHLVAFLPREVADALKSLRLPSDLKAPLLRHRDFLLDNKILVPEGFDQNIPVINIRNLMPTEPKFSLMYLVITEECNLRCNYCFVEGNLQHRPSFMDQETCRKAIDLFVDVVNPEQEQKVRFYGGEPFLNFGVFSFAVKKLRELEHEGKLSNLEIAIATNGTAITSEAANLCHEYDVNVSVSIDGPKDIHNAARMKLGGHGSYSETLRGYKLLQEKGVNPAISCTISRHNVTQLEDIVRFFLEELKPKGFGFNFLLDFKDIENPSHVSIELAAYKLLKVFEILRERGIYEDRIMRRLSKVLNNQFHIKDCAGYGHQIIVAPEGNIGPCHVFLSIGKYVAGNIHDIDHNLACNPVFVEFNRRSPFYMPQCWDCSSISICGGGCAFEPYNKKGIIWEKDERACVQCESLINWVVDDLWKRRQK